jgi:hypothetical protein
MHGGKRRDRPIGDPDAPFKQPFSWNQDERWFALEVQFLTVRLDLQSVGTARFEPATP